MQVSTLSEVDSVSIRASLGAMENRTFFCDVCQGQFRGRPDREEMLRREKQRKACEKPGDVARAVIGNINFLRCPGNFVSPAVFKYYSAFLLFEKGVMPFEGALFDQPNKVIEVFDLIGEIESERKRKEIEKLNRKQNRGRQNSIRHSGKR